MSEPSNKDIMREIERVESRLGKVSGGCRGGSRKRKIDLVTPMNAVKEPVTGGGSRDEFLAKEDEPIEVLSATLSASLSPPVHKASFDDFSDCSQVGMECEGGGSDSKKDMNGSFSPLQGKKSLRFFNRKRKDNVLSLTPEIYDKVQKGEQLSFYHPFQKCRLTVKIHNPSNTKVGIGRPASAPNSTSVPWRQEDGNVVDKSCLDNKALDIGDKGFASMGSEQMEVVSPHHRPEEEKNYKGEVVGLDPMFASIAAVDDHFIFSSAPRTRCRVIRSHHSKGKCTSYLVVRQSIPVPSLHHRERGDEKERSLKKVKYL